MFSRRKCFESAVEAAVSRYLADYGFAARKTSVWSIISVESDLWELTVTDADSHIGVYMRLISEAMSAPLVYELPKLLSRRWMAEPAPEPSKDVMELASVLGVLEPDLPEADRFPRKVWSRWGLRSEVSRRLQNVATFCKPLLEGDLDLWRRIRELEQIGFRRRRSEDETWEVYLDRLRNAGKAALRSRHYWESNSYYQKLSMVGAKLTFVDRFRWWRARRHLFFMR